MVPQPDSDQLRETLLSLKLDSMADNLDALCDQAAKEEWPYATQNFSVQLNQWLNSSHKKRISCRSDPHDNF